MIGSTLSLILLALFVLSILILVHELGHFLVAKKAGVWVEEFGIGLPPRILGKKIGETLYSINLLPIGGFVRLHGEIEDKKLSKPERAFLNKPKKTRALICLAGIIMNFLLAVACFSVFYSFSGILRETDQVRILEIMTDSPAQTAGLIIGDTIIGVNGQKILTTTEFVSIISENRGKKVIIEIERESADEKINKKISVRPRENPPEEGEFLGVVVSSEEIYYPPFWQRPFVGIYYGFREALCLSKAVVLGIISIFVDVSHGQAPKGVVGPVGITALIAYVANLGLLPLINFIGIISVNLAILNLIPFPALDGSKLLFLGVECLFGRRVLPQVESIVQTVGMILLFLLLLAITSREIPTLIRSGSISGFVDSILR